MGKINYEIEIEIFKGEGCDHHRLGEKYRYPEDAGKLCPWLLDERVSGGEAQRKASRR